MQAGNDWVKDKFIHVLRRQRFGHSEFALIQWTNEGPGDSVYDWLNTLHDESERRGVAGTHPGILYAERMGNEVVAEPDGKMYVVEERMHPTLMPQAVHRGGFTASPPLSPQSPRTSRVAQLAQQALQSHALDTQRIIFPTQGLSRSRTCPVPGPGDAAPRLPNTLRHSDGATESGLRQPRASGCKLGGHEAPYEPQALSPF